MLNWLVSQCKYVSSLSCCISSRNVKKLSDLWYLPLERVPVCWSVIVVFDKGAFFMYFKNISTFLDL